MRSSSLLRAGSADSPKSIPFEGVISAIGTVGFGNALLGFLHRTCRASYCASFHVEGGRPRPELSMSMDSKSGTLQTRRYIEREYWREDPLFAEVVETADALETRVIRLDVRRLPHNDFREEMYDKIGVREKLMIYGGQFHQRSWLSILRCCGSGPLGSDELTIIRRLAGALLASVAKHEEIVYHSDSQALALASLPSIEQSIALAHNEMPRRETQVCARILYGLSGIAIALDLGISEQTVLTYRKRLYRRLGIGSQRELLLWYVDIRRHSAVSAPASAPLGATSSPRRSEFAPIQPNS